MFAKAYLALKERQMKEINDFPMAYAFNKQQLEEAFEKLGNPNKAEVCTYLGIGDILRKSDVPAITSVVTIYAVNPKFKNAVDSKIDAMKQKIKLVK